MIFIQLIYNGFVVPERLQNLVDLAITAAIKQMIRCLSQVVMAVS